MSVLGGHLIKNGKVTNRKLEKRQGKSKDLKHNKIRFMLYASGKY